jgi:hypothetical protein
VILAWILGLALAVYVVRWVIGWWLDALVNRSGK